MKRFAAIPCYFICVSIGMILLGCTDGHRDNLSPKSSGTASAVLTIQWHNTPSVPDSGNTVSPKAVDCGASGIETVTCWVYDESNAYLTNSDSWPCDAHNGQIDGIPAGQNRTFVILGADAGGNTLYQGQITGKTISPGKINDVGTIDAHPFIPALSTPADGENITADTVSLQWDSVPNAHEYHIVVSADESFADSPILDDKTGDTTYTLSNLSESTTYYWKVSALDIYANRGVESKVRTFTYKADIPVTLWYRDADSDQYGDPNNAIPSVSQPSGYVADNTDCNDQAAAINPAADEICNERDDNCNAEIDEGLEKPVFYLDSDNDNYGDPNSFILACNAQEGYVEDSTDCNDNDASINPGAEEIPFDGIDQNCDGVGDSDFTFDDGSSQGWTMEKGIFSYIHDTITPHEPSPFIFNWDDMTQYPGEIGGDGLNNDLGTISAKAPEFFLPDGWPGGTYWFIDLLSPDISTNSEWQNIMKLSLNSRGDIGNSVQVLLDVTRKSDGVKTNLREEDSDGYPIFHSLTANWRTINADYGDTSAYNIDKIRIRIFGETAATPGSGEIYLDNVIPSYRLPTLGLEGTLLAASAGEFGPYLQITFDSDFGQTIRLASAVIDFSAANVDVGAVSWISAPIVQSAEVIDNKRIEIRFSEFSSGKTANIGVRYLNETGGFYTPPSYDYANGTVSVNFSDLPSLCSQPLEGIFSEIDPPSLEAEAIFSCQPNPQSPEIQVMRSLPFSPF